MLSLAAFCVALRLLLLIFHPALAAPTTGEAELSERQTGGYWLPQTTLRGSAPYGPSGYKIYRDVTKYGATGNGQTDDTAAINTAMSDGGRCGWPYPGPDCNSTTTTPAIVYFPAGKYLVSTPIIQYYMTQMIGDPTNPPTLVASSGFQGMAVIDADPYNYNVTVAANTPPPNWYINQNNFYRQIRNFVIDLTGLPMTVGAGIHWQVAQATSLQNIVFNMVQGGGEANTQKGIDMDNGSGGFMSDLTFNGGGFGAFLGSQQFTSRNMTFNGCNTAVFMNWNWGWNLKSLNINNCGTGVDIATDPTNQSVGSITLLDSKISNTKVGVNSSFTANSVPLTGGTMYIDNVDFTGTSTAVQGPSGVVLQGGSIVNHWGQGRVYSGSVTTGNRVVGTPTAAPSKPASLLSNGGLVEGAFVEASRPQYANTPVASFVGLQGNFGAHGDGAHDDTGAVQTAVNSVKPGQVLYVEHGQYLISNTITIPPGVSLTGECWPMFMAYNGTNSSAFQDQTNPQPVIQVGAPGAKGDVAISDLVIQTRGSVPGAILMEWNLASSNSGASGLWDVHWRIGGSAGTDLQSDNCLYQLHTTQPDLNCAGAYMLLHLTNSAAGVYMENNWLWTADHELDIAPNEQVQVYNARGLLVESQGPVWMYGHAVEHNTLYNYQLSNASDIYMGLIQTETPYYQPDVPAPAPFLPAAGDPDFSNCQDTACDAWGLRVENSNNVLIYSTGLYSFFQTWNTACGAPGGPDNCQQNMVDVSGGSNVNMFALTTKAAINMLTYNGATIATGADNMNGYAQTILQWSTPGGASASGNSSAPLKE